MKKHEQGQALTETMVVIMILMVAVMGLTAVVSLERRLYLENLVTIDLGLTFSTFGSAERSQSEWPDRHDNPQDEAERLAELILNTPVDPFDETPGANQVPLRVSIVSQSLYESNCQDELSVRRTATFADSTHFAVHGCSKERGWLRPVTRFLNSSSTPEEMKILEDPDANLVTSDSSTKGLFAAQGAFAYSQRASFPERSYHLRPGRFDSDYAGSGDPGNNKNLNRDCFFNPYSRMTKCEPKPMFGAVYLVLGKISFKWILKHFAKCAPQIAKNSFGVPLVAAGLGAEVLFSWKSGSTSMNCSWAEKEIKMTANSRKQMIKLRTEEVIRNEDALLGILQTGWF